MKVIHPRHVSRGDICTYHKKKWTPPMTSWNISTLGKAIFTTSTSKSWCPAVQSRAIPPCCGLVAFNVITWYPSMCLGYQASVSLVLVKTAHPTPIWRNPLAAAANPALHALLMFQVAMEKVPLPPGRGGAGETYIVVYSLLIKLIIN